jgi:hypothetical protein
VLKQRGDSAIAQACEPVSVLHHQHPHPRIGQ